MKLYAYHTWININFQLLLSWCGHLKKTVKFWMAWVTNLNLNWLLHKIVVFSLKTWRSFEGVRWPYLGSCIKHFRNACLFLCFGISNHCYDKCKTVEKIVSTKLYYKFLSWLMELIWNWSFSGSLMMYSENFVDSFSMSREIFFWFGFI